MCLSFDLIGMEVKPVPGLYGLLLLGQKDSEMFPHFLNLISNIYLKLSPIIIRPNTETLPRIVFVGQNG